METSKPKNQSSLCASTAPVLSGAVGTDGANLFNPLRSAERSTTAVIDEKLQSSTTLDRAPDDFPGGRDRHVRDVNAPFFQNASSTVFVNFPSPSSPLTPDSTPPTSHSLVKSVAELSSLSGNPENIWAFASPPTYPSEPSFKLLLTPRSSSDSLRFSTQLKLNDTSSALASVFPAGLKDVEETHKVPTAQLPMGLKGVIADRSSGIRSAYIFGLTQGLTSTEHVKDLVVRVLDFADEEAEADDVVFVLEKKQAGLRELLQGLLYAGGTVIKDQDEVISDKLVLVGIEI
ncbi:expressed protein [Phakopsora pachyrhizi]|uniref:Expressed protein n=1 Tax=Phakopsora pachyrhizi TaxID=170000 RepID=A0AAV0BPS3_PHAPC|nr:expressed protein [Phakopsora pachyrhizi]